MPVRFLLLLALLLLAAPVPAAPPRVGDPVPDLGVDSFLNAPDDAAIPVGEKVVVLEFWATWCGPCVSAIPHLNELTRRFEGRDVAFVSVTGEEEGVVGTFLERRPIAGWVGLDPDGSAAAAFGVTSIPRTIVIGRDGRVAADTYPTSLEPRHIEAALAGEAVDLPPRREPGKVVPLRGVERAAVVEAWLRPSADGDAGRMSTVSGADRWTAVNCQALTIVSSVAQGHRPGVRLAMEATLPGEDERFDLHVRVPEGGSRTVDELAWLTVAHAFGLARYDEDREVEVYLLRPVPGEADKLPPAAAAGPPILADEWSMEGLRVDQTATLPTHLLRSLDVVFARPVLLDWDRREPFDVRLDLPTTAQDVADEEKLPAANAALGEYGLELVPARRTVRFTVVTDAGR